MSAFTAGATIGVILGMLLQAYVVPLIPVHARGWAACGAVIGFTLWVVLHQGG